MKKFEIPIKNYIPIRLRFLSSLIHMARKLSPESKTLKTSLDYLNTRVLNTHKKRLFSLSRECGSIIEVERVSNINVSEFHKTYLKYNVPVIFEGAASDWPATKKWNLDFFQENYGDNKYNILEWPRNYKEQRVNKDTPGIKNIIRLSANEFVRRIRAGENLYLRGCPILEESPELIDDLDDKWLTNMNKSTFGSSYQTFISSGNIMTPTHNESTCFFFALFEGEKVWEMVPSFNYPLLYPEPDRTGYNYSQIQLHNINEEKFPGANLLDRYRCTLKPGDVLFVPAWMWHEVETTKESWALSYKFTSLSNILTSWHFTIDRILLGKPAILPTLWYSIFGKPMGDRENNHLIPKLFKK